MNSTGIITFFIYSACLLAVVLLTYRKQNSDTDYVLGNRSLNKWLVALSAHASDMSDWLFMGYPMLIFTTGIFSAWVAIGLTVFMFLNWQFVAPKIRLLTGTMDNLTLYSYFETKLNDKTKMIRLFSAFISFLFLTVYISAELVGMGFLVYSLFGFSYTAGITIGLFVIATYVFMGGYKTVAWIDLFQGTFLLLVVVVIPFKILFQIGGLGPVMDSIKAQHLQTSLFPDFSMSTVAKIIFLSVGWGIGYFGQPHIITKFMGIKNADDIKQAKYIGISWQVITLGAATIIGMIGINIFPHGLSNPQLVALDIVKSTLSPVFSGLILCAILAATTNVMAAQILVVASSMGEDIYKGFLFKNASSFQTLWASRISVVIVGIIAYIIAYYKIRTIYHLVFYAWSGLGASFGPLLLFSLYSNRLGKNEALSGMIVGAAIAAVWPCVNRISGIDIPPIIPAFLLNFLTMYTMLTLSTKKNYKNY